MGLPYIHRRTINLAKDRRKKPDLVSLFFALLLLLGIICGTAALQLRVRSADRALAEVTAQLEAAAAENADYRDLSAEYHRLTAVQIKESTQTDRLAVLSLVSRRIFPAATVRSFRLSGNTAVLQLSGISLDRAGELLEELRKEPLVSELALSNIGGETGTVTVTVSLKGEEAAS